MEEARIDDLIGEIETLAEMFPALYGKICFFREWDDFFSLSTKEGESVCTRNEEPTLTFVFDYNELGD